jgi:hypothetical protein
MDQENEVQNAGFQEINEPEDLIQLSQTDAMAGTITEPGETFDTIARSPRKTYWVIPILIYLLVNVLVTFLFLRNPEFVDSVMNKQIEKMEKNFDEKVKSGAMSREQANQFMNTNGTFFLLSSYGGAIIGPFLVLFVLSLIYLTGMKIFKAEFDYVNILNVIGLALLISAIGGIIDIALSLITGKFPFNLSIATALGEDMLGAKLHTLLSKFDIFNIWFYTVISIGLSKIGRISFAKAAAFVFLVWVIYSIATSFIFG